MASKHERARKREEREKRKRRQRLGLGSAGLAACAALGGVLYGAFAVRGAEDEVPAATPILAARPAATGEPIFEPAALAADEVQDLPAVPGAERTAFFTLKPDGYYLDGAQVEYLTGSSGDDVMRHYLGVYRERGWNIAGSWPGAPPGAVYSWTLRKGPVVANVAVKKREEGKCVVTVRRYRVAS